MTVVRRPDPVMRRQIEMNSRTASFMCWTCGSCDFECPVNIAHRAFASPTKNGPLGEPGISG